MNRRVLRAFGVRKLACALTRGSLLPQILAESIPGRKAVKKSDL
jgi:hypothetical protein